MLLICMVLLFMIQVMSSCIDMTTQTTEWITTTRHIQETPEQISRKLFDDMINVFDNHVFHGNGWIQSKGKSDMLYRNRDETVMIFSLNKDTITWNVTVNQSVNLKSIDTIRLFIFNYLSKHVSKVDFLFRFFRTTSYNVHSLTNQMNMIKLDNVPGIMVEVKQSSINIKGTFNPKQDGPIISRCFEVFLQFTSLPI